MARPRKPTAVLEMKGAFREHPNRRRPHEPKPSGTFGDAPAHFSAEQAACWNELAAYAPARVLTNADRWLGEIACVLMAEFRARGELASMKLALLTNLLGKMGMTPSDRARLCVPAAPIDDASPWAQFAVIPGGKEGA